VSGAVTAPIARLGARASEGAMGLGRLTRFAGWIALAMVRPPFRFRSLLRASFDAGVLSLAIVCASGIAVGMVLGLQGYTTLVRFGAEESLGAVVGLTLIRELGPVVTGLLVTGRAGSATTAEIGAMVATEQLDGLRMMSIDPVDFVVVPKAIALTLAMPLLSALFIVFSIFGGYLVGVELLGVDGGSYLSSLENSVRFGDDVLQSLTKSFVFGLLVALISTYRGYMSPRNAEGVSRSTTQTVVSASVSILVADYIITAFWGV
jgi:phospholipid/cholesterol/gamma-HCH transport system permease protein